MNDPIDPKKLCERGQECVRQRKFDDAIELFNQCIELDKRNADAHEGLATIYYFTGQLEKSRDEWERVTLVDSRRSRAFVNLGAICNRLGDHKKAVDVLRRALQRDKKSADAHYNLGIAQKNLNQLAMAVNAYREALKLDPTMAEGWQNIGNVYLDMGNTRQAINSFQKALEIRPDFDKALRGLERAQAHGASAKQAISPFGRLVDETSLASHKDADDDDFGRQLTPAERYEDRQFVRDHIRQLRDDTTEWIDTLANRLESSLLTLSREMAQSERGPGLEPAWRVFRSAVAEENERSQQVMEELDRLRKHERRIRDPAAD